MNPHHLHPLFMDTHGNGSSDLQTQSAILLLKLTGVPTADSSKILHVNHKAVEDLERRLDDVRRRFVEFQQKTMKVGDGHSWMDVEGDEATVTKTNEADGDQSKPIRWEQWLAGDPTASFWNASTHLGPTRELHRSRQACGVEALGHEASEEPSCRFPYRFCKEL